MIKCEATSWGYTPYTKDFQMARRGIDQPKLGREMSAEVDGKMVEMEILFTREELIEEATYLLKIAKEMKK